MMTRFPPKRDYSSLSVQDLLDARDAYHVHLAHLANVIATAIGRYRIRCGDWYDEHPPNEPLPEGTPRVTGPRTLYNSVVRPWSWPCVLVFVNDWIARDQFGAADRSTFPPVGKKGLEPDQMVPRALYLSDGRVVPTCVIQVTEQTARPTRAQTLSFPKSLIGGGYLLSSEVQGREHLGSVGCLVTNGTEFFALTNRHVTGDEGRVIFSVFEGNRVRVGISDRNQVGKKPFAVVYKGWPGTNVLSNLDAGLVRVDDLSQWTTHVVGLGPIDRPADLTTDTITLDLIGCPVRAFGGASGLLLGKIDALFYRYKSIGGLDYMADLLIGPRSTCPHTKSSEDSLPELTDISRLPSGPGTLHGDSGTLWCLEQDDEPDEPSFLGCDAKTGEAEKPRKRRLRPIALQWGGHVIVENGTPKTTSQSYALATCLSTVCRELDVDIVRDWNSGLPEYWGDVGHYTIGALACLQVSMPGLKELMEKNLDRVSYEEANLRPSTFKGLSKQEFVPLADVPDKVWKMFGEGRRGRPEHPNHFADMDKKNSKEQTLLDICSGNGGEILPARVAVDVWQAYYDDVEDKSRGCLPFRVWQLYDAMVSAVKKKDVTEYICAAGILAHYVGDACQPLHISYMFDGDPNDTVPGDDERMIPRAKGIHSTYETKMLNRHVTELIQKLNARLDSKELQKPPLVASGHAAAVATVKLMRDTFHALQPRTIIDTYNSDNESDLWDAFGENTVTLMAQGCLTLAMLWESAWKEGSVNGEISDAELGPVKKEKLAELYRDPDFIPSRTLDAIGELLT